MRATGRARFRQRRSQPASEPLNFRFRGYNADSATEYWKWLGSEGVAAELRFLKADMLFPFWYGGAMFGSMYLGVVSVGCPVNPALLFVPVAITVIADWAENLIHIRQLARFNADEPLQTQQIRIASLATSTKLLFFLLSTLLVVTFSVWVLMSGVGAST